VADHGAEIRALRADDDLDAQLDMAERAFGVKGGDDRVLWRKYMDHATAEGTALGAFDGDRPVGAALFFAMQQWWHGRAVPMAGVSGVKIAPEDRGRGTGRALMSRLLEEIAAQGYPLSVLYPATMPIYRSLGWELAGGRYFATVPSRSLRDLPGPDYPGSGFPGTPAAAPFAPRRPGLLDAEAVIGTLSQVHQASRHCGPFTWDREITAAHLARPDWYRYLCEDGYTSYRWHGEDALFVERLVAGSAQTLRGLWSIIASHGSTADKVHLWVSPDDPWWHLTRERDADIGSRRMWMLRVVDAPAAIAARGFPSLPAVRATLIIADASRPANSGTWTLTVADGQGELTAGGDGGGALTVGARGLAALYAGIPVASMRLAGLAAGPRESDDVLDAAFSASPFLLDAF
jgi:predicted acetyltransferase